VERGSLRGKRNDAVLALLIGRGLRRGELLELRVDSIRLREDHWVIADLLRKAGHVRTVPVPSWVKDAIDEWKQASGVTEGALFRSIHRAGRVWGTGMTSKLVWLIVREAASQVGIEKLAPHDLRRYAAWKIDAESPRLCLGVCGFFSSTPRHSFRSLSGITGPGGDRCIDSSPSLKLW
jgi:integrase